MVGGCDELDITRGLLSSGTLKRYIGELSITGLTSNPTIFDHAITKSQDYDTAVRQKMREGKPRIELNPSTGGAPASVGLPGGPNTIVVGVWMLQPGEDMVVAKRLREVLREASRA